MDNIMTWPKLLQVAVSNDIIIYSVLTAYLAYF